MALPRGVKPRGVLGWLAGCRADSDTRHFWAASSASASGGVGKGKCGTCSKGLTLQDTCAMDSKDWQGIKATKQKPTLLGVLQKASAPRGSPKGYRIPLSIVRNYGGNLVVGHVYLEDADAKVQTAMHLQSGRQKLACSDQLINSYNPSTARM